MHRRIECHAIDVTAEDGFDYVIRRDYVDESCSRAADAGVTTLYFTICIVSYLLYRAIHTMGHTSVTISARWGRDCRVGVSTLVR